MADHDPTAIFTSVLGGGVVGSIVTAVVQVFRKPSAPDEMIRAAAEAAKSMLGGLESALDRATAEAGKLREELGVVRAEVAELKAEHAQCREALEASATERAELRGKIDELMAGPIAGLGERDLFS